MIRLAQEKVLVVDDEKEIAELIRDYLETEGFQVSLSFDGEQAMERFRSFGPQLVILDIMMPKIDGMEVCRMMRAESSVPILMLSAKKGDIDKILGLGLGADDYITKPFVPGELIARVKAHLRRYIHLSGSGNRSKPLKFGQLEIDLKSYNVFLEGREIDLSAKEFEVLKFLAIQPGQVFTREQIFNQVWGYGEYGDLNTVTVYVRKIREKIEDEPAKPRFIKTVWGVGYKFDGGQL